jgi:hypothetical protein
MAPLTNGSARGITMPSASLPFQKENQMTLQNPAFINRTLHSQHRYFLNIISKNKTYITEALLNDDICKEGFTELHQYLDTLQEALNEITEDFILEDDDRCH